MKREKFLKDFNFNKYEMFRRKNSKFKLEKKITNLKKIADEDEEKEENDEEGGLSSDKEDEVDSFGDSGTLMTEGVPISVEAFHLKPMNKIRRKASSRFSGIQLIDENELGLFKKKPVIKVLK